MSVDHHRRDLSIDQQLALKTAATRSFAPPMSW